jgi:hypothetical protein
MDQSIQGGVLGQAEDILNGVLLAPLHGFSPAIMAVAANGDDRLRPVLPDAPNQTARMGAHLLAVRRFAGSRDGDDAVAGFGVVDVDRQEAVLIVMRVEQRQLLAAMHGIRGLAFRSRHVNVPKRRGIVDIEGNGLRWLPVALAPQVPHGPPHPDQRALIRRILPVSVSLARANSPKRCPA